MIFEQIESNVRGYCRSFPAVFKTARGATLTDESGRTYIDFLAGAGTLNYGHNNPRIKTKVIEYLENDGLLHGLDMYSVAKRDFLETFNRCILEPRELDYKIQFTGPTGTNAVEAALKLARKVTGRTNVVAFTNGFHGVTLGSVSTTGNQHYRAAAGVPLGNVAHMPFCGYFGTDADTIGYLRKFIEDGSSGLDKPAAVIVETVQGEGGVNVASWNWLQHLAALCQEHEILLIVDDIQVGCGRTGNFFSFEEAGIVPDIVTLSKSLGAYGLPMSIVLMKPELDVWKPGEHNGTFRGNNLAFVAASEALRQYWNNTAFSKEIKYKSRTVRNALELIRDRFPEHDVTVRGRGLIYGLAFENEPALAQKITKTCFKRGLVIETSGAESQVIKLLPPLVIEEPLLKKGLDILIASAVEVLSARPTATAADAENEVLAKTDTMEVR